VNTTVKNASTKAPARTASPPVVVRRRATKPIVRPALAASPSHLVVCAECAYAELYAEEPRARCDCAESAYTRQIVFAGQAACASMTPRDEADLSLAWCTPGLKTAHARFVQPRPRVR
jgi:hypothetical protein